MSESQTFHNTGKLERNGHVIIRTKKKPAQETVTSNRHNYVQQGGGPKQTQTFYNSGNNVQQGNGNVMVFLEEE